MTGAEAAAALELVDVTRTYPGEVPTTALRGVDLRIDPGEQVAVVGPSGSGKSTLLALAGALDRPTTGTVRIGGADLADLPDAALAGLRAARLGFVFQQFHLLGARTALDNVAEGALYRGWPPGRRRAAAAELLDRVGLAARRSHLARQLSGGERQRVAIARALIGDPAILLADEPTGNLDSAAAAGVLDLLRGVGGAAGGMTMVVITHDPEVARAFPRVLGLRDGRLVHDSAAVAA